MPNVKRFSNRGRQPGDLAVSFIFLAFSLFLLFALPFQTSQIAHASLLRQPGFWPGIALTVMTLCAFCHAIGAFRNTGQFDGRSELIACLKPLEYALWFMAYVWIVPNIGYLPATLIFVSTLAYRVGYRRPVHMLYAALFAVTVVLVFKSFLHVNIPAGALYEALPNPYRSFMMTYF